VDISILKYLDIMIGLSVVMILLSAVVTAITQVINSWTYSRARRLRSGLEVLITQVDAKHLAPHSRYLAEAVTRHPMIGSPNTVVGDYVSFLRNYWRKLRDRKKALIPFRNPGSVIEREELIRILLEFAADEGPYSPDANQAKEDTPHVQVCRYIAPLAIAVGVIVGYLLCKQIDVPPWLVAVACILQTFCFVGLWKNDENKKGRQQLADRWVRVVGFIALTAGLCWKGYRTVGLLGLSPAFTIVVLILQIWKFPPEPRTEYKNNGNLTNIGIHWKRLAGAYVAGVSCAWLVPPQPRPQEWTFWALILTAPLLTVVPIALLLAVSPPADWKQMSQIIDEKARQALKDSLASKLSKPDGGDLQPAGALKAYRSELLKLENEHPEMAAHTRQTKALLSAVQGDFVGKINGWFDQTMDRTTQQFTTEARLVTVAVALLVACALRVDSFDLLKRLSIDDKFRASLVEQAKSQQDKIEKAEKTAADLKAECIRKNGQLTAACGLPPDPKTDDIKQKRDEIESALADLRKPSMAIVPSHLVWEEVSQIRVPADWPVATTTTLTVGSTPYTVTPGIANLKELEAAIRKALAPVRTYFDAPNGLLFIVANDTNVQRLSLTGGATALEGYLDWDKWGFSTALPGIAFSWVLLSLGAPFWYSLLKDTLKLRSNLAKKEEQSRIDRAQENKPETKTQASQAKAGNK
jgi:hypothetical protein